MPVTSNVYLITDLTKTLGLISPHRKTLDRISDAVNVIDRRLAVTIVVIGGTDQAPLLQLVDPTVGNGRIIHNEFMELREFKSGIQMVVPRWESRAKTRILRAAKQYVKENPIA